MKPILEVKNISMEFGGLRAIDQLSLSVGHGEIVALIGPNGAGKTTFFNCVTGLYVPTAGDILVHDKNGTTSRINGLKPNVITEKGLGRTFQNIRLFSEMTVLENVMIGRHCRSHSGIIGALFRNRTTVTEEKDIASTSYALLQKVGLAGYVNEFAKNLPYGAQRRLEIARALATDPLILLLDEPAAGMNPKETEELDELIIRIRDEIGVSILMIEHDMKLVMSISDRIYVMDYGRQISQGTPYEVRHDPVVIKAYLGDEV